MPLSILIVEDDVEIREMMVEALTREERYKTQGAGSIGQAQVLMSEYGEGFDVLLLDVGLPDGDGREFCASLRQQGFDRPILMLTGLGHEDDVVSGLESGADDYLVKPFGIAELLARVAGQLRHTAP